MNGTVGPEVVEAGRMEIPVTDVVGFYQHGWHSWCESRWIDPSQPSPPIADPIARMGHADPVHALDTVPGGSGLGAVEHRDGSITLLGALAGGAWVHLEDGRLVGTYEDGAGPWVSLDGGEVETFDRYARLLAERLGRRGGSGVRLWASWYSFYEDVTERKMHEAIAGLDGLELDIIQVDDGWQQAIGDWEPNDDFPSGMADMADRIRAGGRRAGLWLAPFIVAPQSRLATERPELLLRTAAGDPVVAGVNWGGPYWALDVTHRETREHLAAVLSELSRAGYDFFKLDFIYAGALPGEHAEPTSRAEAFRNACRHLRAAVGKDTYLLACGAPILESIGVFDGIRIGPDVGPSWDDGTYASAGRAMVTSAHRLWLAPAIDTDPDVVYFRKTELSTLTARHIRFLAEIAGFKGTSDTPASLTDNEREALAAFLIQHPDVEQRARYRWHVGEHDVDFEPIMSAGNREPQWRVAG